MNSAKGRKPGLHQPETIRLWNEVDEQTKKLEHEKRKLVIKEGQIKQVLSEIQEKEAAIARLRPAPQQARRDNTKMANNKHAIK